MPECNVSYGDAAPIVRTWNGYRARRWDTRAGTINLQIPKLRRGSYFPDWLPEPRRRSEKALVQIIADCYFARRPARQ